MDNLPSQTLRRPVEAIEALTEHFYDQDERLAQAIAQNLDKQLIFIREGVYEV